MDSGVESRLTRSSFLCGRVVPRIWRTAPDAVVPLANDSILLQTIEHIFQIMALGWRAVTSRHRVRAILDGPFAPAADRVRLGGWLVLSAATTHVLLVGISDLVAPPAAGLGWVAVVPFAAACILKPQAVIAAWQARRLRVPIRLRASAQRQERCQAAPSRESV